MKEVSSDDQVKAYIKKIMSQLDKWMVGGKISKLVVVITSKDTGEHVERWQFDVGQLRAHVGHILTLSRCKSLASRPSRSPRRQRIRSTRLRSKSDPLAPPPS
jgi:hypothetical protein